MMKKSYGRQDSPKRRLIKFGKNMAVDMEEEVLVRYRVREEGQVQKQRRGGEGEWPESQAS